MKTLLPILIICGGMFAQSQPAKGPAPPVATAKRKATANPPPPEPTQKDIDELKALVSAIKIEEAKVPLDATAKAATDISTSLVGSANIPEPGRDLKVMYTFGAGMPVVVCAPLRVCVIELQAGEHTTAAPTIGDNVRWDVTPQAVGHDEDARMLVVIKPHAAGLDTNLVITTDRRAYYMRLISDEKKYTALVAFNYPDDAAAKWAEVSRQHQEERKREEEAKAKNLPPAEPEIPTNLNYVYESKVTKGKDKTINPMKVGDDGTRIYIKMQFAATKRDMPVLLVISNGKESVVNYRLSHGDTMIVDRLFEHAALVSGVGKHQLRAEINKMPEVAGK